MAYLSQQPDRRPYGAGVLQVAKRLLRVADRWLDPFARDAVEAYTKPGPFSIRCSIFQSNPGICSGTQSMLSVSVAAVHNACSRTGKSAL